MNDMKKLGNEARAKPLRRLSGQEFERALAEGGSAWENLQKEFCKWHQWSGADEVAQAFYGNNGLMRKIESGEVLYHPPVFTKSNLPMPDTEPTKLDVQLRALGDWCYKRAGSLHNENTTRTKLRQKVDRLLRGEEDPPETIWEFSVTLEQLVSAVLLAGVALFGFYLAFQ